jgi:preprotein translocase subunit SecF
MFKPIRLVKKVPNLDFFRFHKLCFALSAFLCLGSVLSLATLGLNFGVDFAGGVLIEVRSQGPADLGQMRDKIGNLNLGDVALQEFGASNDVLIRIERQGTDEKAEMAAVAAVREVLGAGYEYRRVEVVGPKVGAELVTGGILAVTLSLAGIMAYMALRFGWRAGLAGVVAILHDCLTTVGFFSITQLQFDLNVLAAVVTIAGFSINDTVVIDDRIRENLRKYKAMPFRQLINRSVNETMARTVVTNGLVFLAVFALLLLGGPVLFGFAVAMTWGVVLGTYSTVYVAAPLEWYLAGKDTHSAHRDDDEAPAAAKP